MARTIRPQAKRLFFAFILAVLVVVAWTFQDHPQVQQFFNKSESNQTTTSSKNQKNKGKASKDQVVEISTVTWPGHAGGFALNDGMTPNTNSEMFKKFGVTVNVTVDDGGLGRDAFNAGEVDLLWCTLDALPTEYGEQSIFNRNDVRFIAAIDKSRGGDVIVATRNVQGTAESVRGKTIAYAPLTPSHTMILKFLESLGLTTDDVNMVEVPTALEASGTFRGGKADIAAVWSPDDLACLEDVAGSHVLISTNDMPHIIVDGWLVKESVLKEKHDQIVAVVAAWMYGNGLMNTDQGYRAKTAQILTEEMGLFNLNEWTGLLNNVYYPNIQDNLEFFGIEDISNDAVEASKLYGRMSSTYVAEDVMGEGNDPISWRIVGERSVLIDAKELLDNMGHTYIAEGATQFEEATVEEIQTKAQTAQLSEKAVQINFQTNKFNLLPEHMDIIDREIVETAKAISNTYIVIEGHTDSDGDDQLNLALSEKRAKSVANYLVVTHGINPNRVFAQGLGETKPKATNSTEAGKAQNRRTEFKLVQN